MVPRNPPQNDPGDDGGHGQGNTQPKVFFPDVAVAFSTTQDITSFLGSLGSVPGLSFLFIAQSGVHAAAGPDFFLITFGIWLTPPNGATEIAARMSGLNALSFNLTVADSARVWVNQNTLQRLAANSLAFINSPRPNKPPIDLSSLTISLASPAVITTVAKGTAEGFEGFTVTVVDTLSVSGGLVVNSETNKLESDIALQLVALDIVAALFAAPLAPASEILVRISGYETEHVITALGTFPLPLATPGALIAALLNNIGFIVLGIVAPVIAPGGLALSISYSNVGFTSMPAATGGGLLFGGSCAVIPAVPSVSISGPTGILVSPDGGSTGFLPYVLSTSQLQAPVAAWSVDDGSLFAPAPVTPGPGFNIGPVGEQLTNRVKFHFPPGHPGKIYTRTVGAVVTAMGGLTVSTQMEVTLRVQVPLHKPSA